MRLIPSLRAVGLTFLMLLAGLAIAVIMYLRFPWIKTESVSFQNGDVTLVGTLALPRWHDGPYPAAVVVQGSGAVPRWISWPYVMRLVPHGMAVLIYDKRGVGGSSGTYPESGGWSIEAISTCGDMFELHAGDARAGVEWLQSRDDIDLSRIGLAGISRAGWIIPLVVNRANDIAFIVSISAPAVSCGLEDWYSQLTGEYNAFPEYGGPTPYAEGELSDAEIELLLDAYEGPHGYDPEPVLTDLRVPTLWVVGGRDRSVPMSRSVSILERLIADGAPFEIQMYPDGDHMLRPSNSLRSLDYWSDVRVWLIGQGVLANQ